MRIPISIFLAIWAVFIFIFFGASCISVYQMKKFAIRGKGATVPTVMFVSVCSVVLILTLLYLLTVDWNQMFQLGDLVTPSPYLSL